MADGSVAPELHISELKSFKRCKRRWALSELAWLQPQKLSMPLVLGSAIHKGLEAWHRTDDYDAMIAAFDSYMEEASTPLRVDTPWLYVEQEADLIENRDLGIIMLDGYVARYNPEEFRVGRAGGVPLLEIEFRMPILRPTGEEYSKKYAWHPTRIAWEFTGTMDGVVVDEYGYWILERKTTTKTNADYLRLDDQNVAYMAFAILKWPKIQPQLRGVLYDFLRKTKPGPRVKAPLFFRERIYRNKHEIDSMMEQIFYVVQDMERVIADPDHYAYPTPTQDCSWDCSYKTICMAMNNGTDVPTLIEASYKYQQGRMCLPQLWEPQNRE